MEFKDFTAGKDDSDRRLDKVLRILLSNKGLPEIYKLLRNGLIKLNHKKAKPDTHISAGDIISIAAFLLNDDKADDNEVPPKKVTRSAPSLKTNLKIVFENEHLLIIDKPYDRSVHGKKDGLYLDVSEYLEGKNTYKNNSLSFKSGPLHRLDRRTTGLLVFSKSLEGARWFTEGIKNHTIQKKYYGLAQGRLNASEEWKDFISDAGENEAGFYTVNARAKSENQTGDKELLCITIARPLFYGQKNGKEYTLVEYSIKTGRKHQIRSQSSLHKIPLAGDKAYAASPLPECKNAHREFYLQAYSLTFPENQLGIPANIKIGLSPDFIEQLRSCGIKTSGL